MDTFQDVTTADFRLVVEYLTHYGQGLGRPIGTAFLSRNAILSFPPNKIKAVRINSLGHIRLEGAAKHEEVEIDANDPIFATMQPTYVSRQMGLPLIVQ